MTFRFIYSRMFMQRIAICKSMQGDKAQKIIPETTLAPRSKCPGSPSIGGTCSSLSRLTLGKAGDSDKNPIFGHHVHSSTPVPVTSLSKDQCRAELSALGGGKCPLSMRQSLQAHRDMLGSLRESKRGAPPVSLNSDSDDNYRDSTGLKWTKHDFARLCHVFVDPHVAVAVTQILDGRNRQELDSRLSPWDAIAYRFDDQSCEYSHPDPVD